MHTLTGDLCRRDQDPPVATMPADDDAYWDQFDHAADAPPGHGSAADKA